MPHGHHTITAFLAIILNLPVAAFAHAQMRGKAANTEKIPPLANVAQNVAPPQTPAARQSVKFGKVYEYVNDPVHEQNSADQAQKFERFYYNYGAVTGEQKKEKVGHYFTFFWKPRHKLGEGRIVWDYLQEFDGNTIRTREQPFNRASGWQRTRFAVAGQHYFPLNHSAHSSTPRSGGRVIAWRLRIYEADRLVGETTSLAW